MCGIFGWIKPTGRATTKLDLAEVFRNGLIETQVRGEHATGFWAPRIGLVKDVGNAEDFVDNNMVPDSIASERFVIGHCRLASSKYRANAKHMEDPSNAQPFVGKRYVMIHNGTLGTPKIKKYNYSSKVDSEIILAYCETTSVRNALASINGSATVVIYDKKLRKLFFWTNGERPLAICYYEGIIFFASTRTILRKTLQPKSKFQIFDDISFGVLYEYEILEFDLNNNRFIRREEVDPKPVAKKKMNGTHFQPITRTYGTPQLTRGCVQNPRPLPRGCTANPSSPNPADQSGPYGNAARASALATMAKKGPDVQKQVRIAPNGARVVTYKVTKDNGTPSVKGNGAD